MGTVYDPHVPGETVQYSIDFSSRLSSNDSVASAAWTVAAGVTEGDGSVDTTNGIVSVKLSGSTVGVYAIQCFATTSAGEVLEGGFTIVIRQPPTHPE